MAQNRHQVARTTRRVFGRNNYNRTLETAVDPERQLEISRERRANLVPAEVLYSNNRSTARHRVYEHYSEQRILCIGENQINLRLCNVESYENLRISGLQHIHLGIFMIRLHALHRRSAGTNALVVLRDTRWEDSRQIIATMEVDLSAGTQLVYTFPDMILSVNDFHNHIEVAIQTHGYDTWQGGESNLLITMALTGRLSNTSYMGFQYSVENVVDHLTTTGITAIPGERRSIEELEGMSWHLKPPEQTSVRVPLRVAVNERLNRSVMIRNDNLDEDEEHFIGICSQAPQEEHISYDVCFCESCLNEARILEEEPLNKVRRSNKPKRSKQKSWEKWSTLGEPSGKWDYYVRYDAPPDITPIEEVAATGWGDEFSDDEVTPGKVTILEERSDWDDDERSGGKILVIQEQLAQNQQEFLDEYLPQWDENLAIQKKESGLEWENPFAAKRGENHNHTILHLSKEENDDDDLPYPKFRNFKQMAAQIIKKHEEHAFPSSSSQIESTQSYQPPHDAIMGPPVYPPAQQNPQPFYKPDYQFGYPQGKSKIFNGGYGEYYNSQWTLPPAWTESGVMLVLPSDPGLWSEVISRWESITLNRLNNQTWSDNKAKLAFVENLLGEKDPYRGSTDEQDRAYRDLDRITCEDTKNLWSFLEDFRQLATKSGRLYFPSTTEKLFAKLPPSLSKKIEESFRAKHPGLSSGVLPAIKFTHTFISEICKDAALAKELRDLSLCSAIPIPGYYKNNRKKYGMRKSRTYKGKPHNSHVKPFKRKYKDDRGRVKKCKCFICGKEWHFAKDCRSKQGNIARSAVYQELDLDDNWDIVSADFDNSSVYSISEGEGDTHQSISVMVQDTPIEETVFMAIEDVESDDDLEEEDNQFGHHAFMFHPGPPTKIAEMVQSVGSWKPDKELPVKSKEYTSRLNCPKCQLTTCALCARNYLGKTVNVKRKQPQKQEEEKDFNSNEVKLLKELLKEKTDQVQQMIRDQPRVYENKAAMEKKRNYGSQKKASMPEVQVDEEEFLEINESIYFNQEGSRAFQEQFKPVIDRLKQQGYIGEEPLKHWKKNGELCKLDIINPDVTIEDKPLKHVTPAMEDLFRKHVDSLLKIGAICPSKSRHKTMAMIVNSGTPVDLLQEER
ncbi:Orf y [Tanacetum coccineum]